MSRDLWSGAGRSKSRGTLERVRSSRLESRGAKISRSPRPYYWVEVEKSLETRWRESDEKADADAGAIDEVIEESRISIEASVGDGITDEDYQDRVRSGIAAWKRLVNEVGFDLTGVFRRRELVPFVMIPRHVSGHYGKPDPLSLMARLQQAQEAFVYGVPLGALAIMRSILEIILRKHYQLGDGKLVKLIETDLRQCAKPSY